MLFCASTSGQKKNRREKEKSGKLLPPAHSNERPVPLREVTDLLFMQPSTIDQISILGSEWRAERGKNDRAFILCIKYLFLVVYFCSEIDNTHTHTHPRLTFRLTLLHLFLYSTSRLTLDFLEMTRSW